MDLFFHSESVASTYSREELLFPTQGKTLEGDLNNNRHKPDYLKLFESKEKKSPMKDDQSILIGNIGRIAPSNWKASKNIHGKPKLLGRGIYGTVEKGTYLPTNEKVARKTIFPHPQALDMVIHEAKWLQRLESTGFVPKCYGVIVDDPGKPAILMERLKHYTTLSHLLQRKKRLTMFQRIGIAIEITKAIYYFNATRIYHNDLKPDNIMVNMKNPNKPKIKLIDLANTSDKPVKLDLSAGRAYVCGHFAPELRNGGLSGRKSDIYSLGVVLRALAFGSRQSASLEYVGGVCAKEDPASRPNYTIIFSLLIRFFSHCTC